MYKGSQTYTEKEQRLGCLVDLYAGRTSKTYTFRVFDCTQDVQVKRIHKNIHVILVVMTVELVRQHRRRRARYV